MPAHTRDPLPWPEEWRPVPSRPGLLASNWGRVVLPSTQRPGLNGGTITTRPLPRWGIVKTSRAGGKHVYLGLQTRMYGNLKIHQCVCEAWHGPKPFASALVLHLDENGLNNVPGNLQWGTHQQNMNFPGYKQALSALMQGNTRGVKSRFVSAER